MTKTQFWKALTERYGYQCPIYSPLEGVDKEMEKHDEWCKENCAKIQSSQDDMHYKCWKKLWSGLQNK